MHRPLQSTKWAEELKEGAILSKKFSKTPPRKRDLCWNRKEGHALPWGWVGSSATGVKGIEAKAQRETSAQLSVGQGSRPQAQGRWRGCHEGGWWARPLNVRSPWGCGIYCRCEAKLLVWFCGAKDRSSLTMKWSTWVCSGWRMRRGTSAFTERGGVPGMQGRDVHFGGHCDPRPGWPPLQRERKRYPVIELRAVTVTPCWTPGHRGLPSRKGRSLKAWLLLVSSGCPGVIEANSFLLSPTHHNPFLTLLHNSAPGVLACVCVGWGMMEGNVCVSVPPRLKFPSPATESVSWLPSPLHGWDFIPT